MKIVVTGASGGLGSQVCRVLADQQHDVVAIDRARRDDLPVPVETADLLDRDRITPLFEGSNAVVHLANHTNADPTRPIQIYNENVTMNMNVFQTACDAGARKIVFASSIQVIGGKPANETEVPQVTYLPFDGDTPPQMSNSYALSKHVGEQMLKYFSRLHGIEAAAARFPWMTDASLAPKTVDPETADIEVIQRGFSYLPYEDAASFVAAVLKSDLPGFRVYMPASRENQAGRSPAELIRLCYSHVPLRRPIDEIEALVDVSRIEQETGWSPAPWSPAA